jgi:uncharacterized protein with FMN-binding domain
MTGFTKFAVVAAVAAAAGAAGVLPRAGALDPAPAAAALKDGTWSGPRVHTFYGFLGVDAVVEAGALKDVRVREYPAHDGTSRRINSIAVPYLVKSAVSAGGAQIDTISGATITSAAFLKSLDQALSEAAQ